VACTQREGGREFKNSVADQDDENRIAPAGFDVNGEETWKWTRHPALVQLIGSFPVAQELAVWATRRSTCRRRHSGRHRRGRRRPATRDGVQMSRPGCARRRPDRTDRTWLLAIPRKRVDPWGEYERARGPRNRSSDDAGWRLLVKDVLMTHRALCG
jgi:hypothetical protein